MLTPSLILNFLDPKLQKGVLQRQTSCHSATRKVVKLGTLLQGPWLQGLGILKLSVQFVLTLPLVIW